LLNIEKESTQLINKKLNTYIDYENIILSSGGKDSSVVTYLIREIKPETKIIFNNTSLDCADTYKHIKFMDNVEIINPKEGFYQWRENKFYSYSFWKRMLYFI
jgi:3'-phosphoadenosine 5'-phosphosulfate sulfotransferase (PAPS reductase)/FAD synthetase